MIVFGRFRLVEADSAEAVLRAGGIACQRQTVEEDGMEYVELFVAESDFEKAEDVFDAHAAVSEASLDLSDVRSCHCCGGNKFRWFPHRTDLAVVELLFCECSGDQPLAMRNSQTKIGRYLVKL